MESGSATDAPTPPRVLELSTLLWRAFRRQQDPMKDVSDCIKVNARFRLGILRRARNLLDRPLPPPLSPQPSTEVDTSVSLPEEFVGSPERVNALRSLFFRAYGALLHHVGRAPRQRCPHATTSVEREPSHTPVLASAPPDCPPSRLHTPLPFSL